jgi:hypothetical protein
MSKRAMTRGGVCQTPSFVQALGAVLAASVVACGSPTKPTASVAAAHPLGPGTGTEISYYGQPIVLHLASGVTTGSESLTTTVEVSTDTAFTSLVTTQAAIVTSDGQLTATLAHLPASTMYYWRAKTTGASNVSAVSPMVAFSIGPELVIQPPQAVGPFADTFAHKRPTFVVADAAHTAMPVTLTYHFDVAADPTFHTLVASGAVPETPTQTSFTPTSDLMSGATYYWRALAMDTTKGVTGAFSPAQSFTTINPHDGTWRYTLTLHLVSASECGNPGFPQPAPPLQDLSFDDGLVVSGDHLRYTVVYNFTISVALDLTRTAGQAAGTLQGNVYWPGERHLGVIYHFDVTSVNVDNQSGRVTGLATGSFSDEGFPAYIQCQHAEVAFSLRPIGE